MVTAEDRGVNLSRQLDGELRSVAERVARSTVQVREHGPGGGSGVIWRPDGIVVTNAHVVRGAAAIVHLADGRTLQAEVVDRDDDRDLAVLAVAEENLTAADIGNSDGLRVGEVVLAIGNPLGLVGALTVGIVHAIGGVEPAASEPLRNDRPDARSRQAREWVQADVRLAPGNSGGPLTDAHGRVVGINSMVAGGLALAVPSNQVEAFVRRRGERPILGVVTRPVVVGDGGELRPGFLVLEVQEGGPAESAGLLIGDVLIGDDGVLFTSTTDLAAAMRRVGARHRLRLIVSRAGRRTECIVTLGLASMPRGRAA